MSLSPNASDGGRPRMESSARGLRRSVLEALLTYFMVALTVAWLLGPIREFAIRAGCELLPAILIQAAVTLLILTSSAGWVVEAFDVPPRLGARLAVGGGAVVLLMLGDLMVGRLEYGLSLLALIRDLASPSGGVVVASLVLAALLPVMRGRHR